MPRKALIERRSAYNLPDIATDAQNAQYEKGPEIEHSDTSCLP